MGTQSKEKDAKSLLMEKNKQAERDRQFADQQARNARKRRKQNEFMIKKYGLKAPSVQPPAPPVVEQVPVVEPPKQETAPVNDAGQAQVQA